MTTCIPALVARPLTCLFAALSLGTALPVAAQTRIDASAMYLLPGTFSPGSVAQTQFVFYSFDAVQLSTFSFSLQWSSDQAALETSGPGSMAAWAETLQPFGPLTWQQVSTTEISGRWTAATGAGGLQVLPVSPDQRVQPLLRFQTTPLQTQPLTVRFELPDLRYADGVLVDTGSGFFNSVTLSPVPEPAHGWAMLVGLGLVAAAVRRSIARP